MSNYYKTVTDYFNDKASQYDDVDDQLYWVLSDAFYKEVLKKELPVLIGSGDIKLLDAGAGTGRWTFFFEELFKDSYNINGTLVDISDDMLKIAEAKIKERDMESRFTCISGNIEEMDFISDGSFDLSLSFYNVLSFVEHPLIALKQIHKKLKSGGTHVSVVANKYHAYYFAILANRLKELDLIRNESKVRFNDLMPAMHCFTPEGLAELYKQAGYKDVKIIGGPNFIYPGMEETYVQGQSEANAAKLATSFNFKRLLDLELENYGNKDIVGRGNTLLAIAQK